MNVQERESKSNLTEPLPSERQGVQRYVLLAVWVVVVLTLFFIAIKVIGYGFLPGGDARRHVAKVFTDKPYTDIVVMGPVYKIDHSPGWEWVLRRLHGVTGWNADELSSFSVVAMMLCVFFAPLPWVRRPEAWLAALLAQMVAIPELMTRFSQARPYLITEAILMALLFAWVPGKSGAPSRLKIALTVVGFALSAWMHGAWYLWVLPVAAFFLARRWREAIWLGACWLGGSFLGGLLTGHPIGFLKQAVMILVTIAREQVPQRLLVGEFAPSYGEFATLVLLAVVYFWRHRRVEEAARAFGSPLFWLVAMGWALGFKADRFWADWGMPAALVWLAMELEVISTMVLADLGAVNRLLACGLVAVPLFIHSTNDLDQRYTRSLKEVFLDANEPSLQGWLPEDGGIFYAGSMECFYNTFYKNPRANWRYISGFEPALMPEEDLKVYRAIQERPWAMSAYEPWVRKMRTNDRLEIVSTEQPDLPALEWHRAAGAIWIGRLPQVGKR